MPNRLWIGVFTSLAWIGVGVYTAVAGANETWQRAGWLIVVVGLLRAAKVVRDWKKAEAAREPPHKDS